jgi:hypothetical protein
MNACFGCERQLVDDVAVRGHYICSNQRCIRFGLVSTVYLAPQKEPEIEPQPEINEDLATPEEMKAKEAEDIKDSPTTEELIDRIKPLETEGEVVKDGTDLSST